MIKLSRHPAPLPGMRSLRGCDTSNASVRSRADRYRYESSPERVTDSSALPRLKEMR